MQKLKLMWGKWNCRWSFFFKNFPLLSCIFNEKSPVRGLTCLPPEPQFERWCHKGIPAPSIELQKSQGARGLKWLPPRAGNLQLPPHYTHTTHCLRGEKLRQMSYFTMRSDLKGSLPCILFLGGLKWQSLSTVSYLPYFKELIILRVDPYGILWGGRVLHSCHLE